MTRIRAASGDYPSLKAWRRARRWSMRQAAEYLGISKSTYERLESRQQFVKGAQARTLQTKTRVRVEALVGLS